MAIYGTNGSDWIDVLDGVTNGADTIYGYGGNDVIFALGGNDVLVGGAGADYLDGGTGTDTASYDDSAEGVTIDMTTGDGYGGTAEGDEFISIENVTGSWHEDLIVGNDGNNVLAGLGGNDNLKGGGGSDTLYGDSGNDLLKGGGGADTLNGGAGVDTASYDTSGAAVFVSLIDDTASGGDANGDELNQIENLTGSNYNDSLTGSNGANSLRGLDGNDTLKGYGGSDNLQGGDGNDYLYGMDGSDTMLGGNGNDWIVGGANQDVMTGGAGADTFDFNSISESVLATPDWITDFNDLNIATTDKIDLSGIDANTTMNGNQAFIWIGNNNDWTDDYGAGQLRFNGGYLEGDLDGDHVADFRIDVDGVPVIHDYAIIV